MLNTRIMHDDGPTALVENIGQQPQRHHMALRPQVSVGGGRSSDNMDTHHANIAALTIVWPPQAETPTPWLATAPTRRTSWDIGHGHSSYRPISTG